MIPRRRKWQPTAVLLPGESHGQRSLEGYIPQGHKESDLTEATQHARTHTHTLLTLLHYTYSVKNIRLLPGAGERHSTRDKGHEEGGSAYAKAGSSLGSAPRYSRASTPQNQSLPTLLLCALTSDFTGGCPPPPSHSLSKS